MKRFTLRDAAGNERQAHGTKEMAYLVVRGFRVVSWDWL